MKSRADQLKRYHGYGVWEGLDGGLHFSIPDILAHLCIADTPENRDELNAIAKAEVAKRAPQAVVVVQEKEGR